MIEKSPTVITEYDYDEEFKHLGYSASLIGRSRKAETILLEVARRVSTVFWRKPSLAHCGKNIATSILRPKFVYQLAFAKATPEAIAAIEGGFGGALRSSMSVAQGFPWDVLAGSPDYEGLGYSITFP